MNRHQYRRAAIIAALPGCQTQIAHTTQASIAAVCRWLKKLKAQGKVHIASWSKGAKSGCPPVATYAPGPGPDSMDKPARTPLSVRSKASRLRRMAAAKASQ